MAVSEAQKRAVRKYRQRMKSITIEFSPNEYGLYNSIKANGPSATYLKDLAKADLDEKGVDWRRNDNLEGEA